MKSQVSYLNKKNPLDFFGVSRALIKENLKRLWIIPAVAFLAYFMSGILPFFYDDPNGNQMIISMSNILENHNFFFMTLHLLMPIITSIAVFRFVHNPSSVALTHSMPFTRYQIFNSSIVSGFILMTIPIVATALCFVGISASGILTPDISQPFADFYSNSINIADFYTISAWLFNTLIILFSVYIVSSFAAAISGTSVMHGILSLCLNFLLPALYATLLYYASLYLYGYTDTSSITENMSYLSPFLYTIGKFKNSMHIIFYILFAVAVFVASSLLYNRRKLERAGDAVVFNAAVPILSYLFTLFGMTVFSIWFQNMISAGRAVPASFIGYFFGAVLFFIIGRMIVLKTISIFNLQTLKSFLGFCVLASIFIFAVKFDFTGYENKVPNPDEVSIVKLSTPLSINMSNSKLKMITKNESFGENDLCFTDKANIISFENFHRDIVKNKDNLTGDVAAIIDKKGSLAFKDGEEDFINIHLTYILKSGKSVARSYDIPYSFFSENGELKKIYESDEIKNSFILNDISLDDIISITYQINYPKGNDPNIDLPTKVFSITKYKKEVTDALKKDFSDLTFKEASLFDNVDGIVTVEYKISENLLLKNVSKSVYKSPPSMNACTYIPVRKSDENMHKFLEKYNYTK